MIVTEQISDKESTSGKGVSPACVGLASSVLPEAQALLELTIPYEEKDDAIHQTKTYQKWYYMPPMDIAKYTQGTYIITANVNGNPVSATVDSKYTQWEAGCQYTYTFKISETNTSISFAEVQVEQWRENGVLDNNGNGTTDW